MQNKILADAAIILQHFCSENIITDPDLTNYVKSVTIADEETKPSPSARGP